MMLLRMGNLSVPQFAERVGTEFTDEEIATLEEYRSDPAEFRDESKFHIFSDPAISILIGSEALVATKEIWVAANTRKPFNREITFYPISKEDS